MIKFLLRCSNGHRFDSWFASGAAFDKLKEQGSLSCTECADRDITKAPMAPNLNFSRSKDKEAAQHTQVEAPVPDASKVVNREKVEHLRARQQQIMSEFDYVGSDFAQEARRLHDDDTTLQESGKVGIYGQATREEAESLLDDGIDIVSFDWVPMNDA